MHQRLNMRVSVSLATLIGAAACSIVRAQPPMDIPDEGVEVLARGPMHEAFAAPVVFDPEPGMLVSQAPPSPIEEIPPEEQPEGEYVIWIDGYWSWDDEANSFIWVSGIWRDVPPNREWVPGYWLSTPTGSQWSSQRSKCRRTSSGGVDAP